MNPSLVEIFIWMNFSCQSEIYHGDEAEDLLVKKCKTSGIVTLCEDIPHINIKKTVQLFNIFNFFSWSYLSLNFNSVNFIKITFFISFCKWNLFETEPVILIVQNVLFCHSILYKLSTFTTCKLGDSEQTTFEKSNPQKPSL